jgi:hypothetical protein
MKHSTGSLRPWIILLLAAAMVVAPAALFPSLGSQPAGLGAGYGLSWWTVDGGGVTTSASGGTYALVGTIGQPDAGVLDGAQYGVLGGFWPGLQPAVDYHLHLPLLLRDNP